MQAHLSWLRRAEQGLGDAGRGSCLTLVLQLCHEPIHVTYAAAAPQQLFFFFSQDKDESFVNAERQILESRSPSLSPSCLQNVGGAGSRIFTESSKSESSELVISGVTPRVGPAPGLGPSDLPVLFGCARDEGKQCLQSQAVVPLTAGGTHKAPGMFYAVILGQCLDLIVLLACGAVVIPACLATLGPC